MYFFNLAENGLLDRRLSEQPVACWSECIRTVISLLTLSRCGRTLRGVEDVALFELKIVNRRGSVFEPRDGAPSLSSAAASAFGPPWRDEIRIRIPVSAH